VIQARTQHEQESGTDAVERLASNMSSRFLKMSAAPTLLLLWYAMMRMMKKGMSCHASSNTRVQLQLEFERG
jgi:hypothetical protein